LFQLKIRSGLASPTSTFTTQLFLDDRITNLMHAQQPYASHGQCDALNSTDHVYAQGGSQTQLALTQTSQGYAATLTIGLDVS